MQRIIDHGRPTHHWYVYKVSLTPEGQGTLWKKQWKISKSQREGRAAARLCLQDRTGSCSHEISKLDSPKQDLHTDNTSWHCSVDGEKALTTHGKLQTTDGAERTISLLQGQTPNRLSNSKWSVFSIHVYRQHEMNSADYIHVYICGHECNNNERRVHEFDREYWTWRSSSRKRG